jgi:ATP citrate (pro-S)-lyase
VKALQEYREHLIEYQVSVFVRRAGPNYQEGLRIIREVGISLGIPIHVFGPDCHMTAIVSMALGKTFHLIICSFQLYVFDLFRKTPNCPA